MNPTDKPIVFYVAFYECRASLIKLASTHNQTDRELEFNFPLQFVSGTSFRQFYTCHTICRLLSLRTTYKHILIISAIAINHTRHYDLCNRGHRGEIRT